MKPYYEDELVTLFHGDALEVKSWLKADVLVTDPPYGMAYVSNRRAERSQKISGDETVDVRDKILAAWGDRPALVFGTWRVARPAGTRQLLIWDKVNNGMGDLNLPWSPSHEDVYVIGSGFVGKRTGSVIRAQGYAPADPRRPAHPTPKPVALMEALLGYVPQDNVVADPCAGSGATLVAARNLGRRAIGVELEERYCELIATRLSQQAFDFTNLLAPSSPEVRSSGWSSESSELPFTDWAPENVS